jgi:hypothetical protein
MNKQDKVISIISWNPEGVSTNDLMKKTKSTESSIYSAIYGINKKGDFKVVNKSGFYFLKGNKINNVSGAGNSDAINTQEKIVKNISDSINNEFDSLTIKEKLLTLPIELRNKWEKEVSESDYYMAVAEGHKSAAEAVLNSWLKLIKLNKEVPCY